MTLQDTLPIYRVLARKYRPQSFTDLIGQEPMIQTLTNAFRLQKIPQAWMLTGVRGVGKTTTARILARALNYQTNSINQPTIDMTDLGEHCPAIIDGHHIDVIEMDAASHTGIDHIREIIDQIRYKPAIARYKIYIIDEVHMLSIQAFNGLLKTLEEPPSHTKFIFATTEIRKVPVTILSRCQRFDLRRVELSQLTQHLEKISAFEKVTAETEALNLISRAADGSVRDALSLLDQAIAHGNGNITSQLVCDMLGIADQSKLLDLFEYIHLGKTIDALNSLNHHYQLGADPLMILTELAHLTHLITRLKFIPQLSQQQYLQQDLRERGHKFAQQLSVRVLSRTWQMLLQGLEEVQKSQNALQASEMLIIRLTHAADLPPLDEVIKKLQNTSNLSTTQSANIASEIPQQSSLDSMAKQSYNMQESAILKTSTPISSIVSSLENNPSSSQHVSLKDEENIQFQKQKAQAQEDTDLQAILEHFPDSKFISIA